MFSKARKVLSALVLSATLPVANAAVIDFESLAHNDATVKAHGARHEEDGYLVLGGGITGLVSFGTLHPRFSGSTAVFPAFGVTELEKLDGGEFSLKFIDLTELDAPFPSLVTFGGYHADGSVTTQAFTLDGDAFTPQTFTFDSSFTHLVRVIWDFGFLDLSPHQFDNIVVEDAICVPEPATTATLGLGLLGFAAARRCKQTS